MKSILLILYLLASNFIMGQQLTTVVALDASLSETSGLIFLNNKLITHNDSGNSPHLYEIDTISGQTLRTVVVANATNIDWEDVCMDANHIYIADIGNNYGSRTNLRIFRVAISDYLNTTNDTVYADTIMFSYADQIDFTPSEYATNFDAEALISFNDSLYVFTKNWGDLKSNIYAIPKIPGEYIVSKTDSIDSQGLITGGVYNEVSNRIVLTGYTISAFVIELSSFSGNVFSSGLVQKSAIQPEGSIQIEAIAAIDANRFFISSEAFVMGASYLSALTMPSGLSANLYSSYDASTLYPNPASDIVNVNVSDLLRVEVYNYFGQVVLSQKEAIIDVSALTKGVYYVFVLSLNSSTAKIHRLIVQ